MSAGYELDFGDCEDRMATMDDKSVDVIITDPPYSEHVHGKVRQANLAMGGGGKRAAGRYESKPCTRSVDLGFAHLTREDVFRLSLPFARLARRWAVVFSDHELSHDWRDGLENAGLDVVRQGVWIKRASTPQFSGDRPAAGHEVITLAHPKGRKRWNGRNGSGSHGEHAIWEYPIVNPAHQERHHTTQKPLALMVDLVRAFSDLGETIFDPFAGSGTTGVAALQNGRRFHGCEKQEKYIAIARERLDAAAEGLDLASARAKQVPMFGGAA